MKKISLFALFCILAAGVKAQGTTQYNKALADSLGADEYGMKMYVLVILKTGTNVSATKAETDSLFAGHMANMGKLVKENKLIVAGPLGKNDQTYRGIFILNTKSIDEAKAILATDPAYKAQLLDAEIMNWYGSAALAEYLKADGKIGKYKF